MEDSKVKYFDSYVPSLEELVPVIQQGLKTQFGEVTVGLIDCPDFTRDPYKISVSGLHGRPTIADVGGVHNLSPRVNLDSKYDLNTVVKSIYKTKEDYPISVFGPGGGPFQDTGFCCEFMGSACYHNDGSVVKSIGVACRTAYVDEKTGEGRWADLPNDHFGLMGNFYLSKNKPGKVLRVKVKKRIGKENFTASIRKVLLSKYGEQKPVSMGGVFLINSGVAKLHIMPKYWPKEPSTDDSINNEWLKYFHTTKNPLVCLSVFHSHDPGYNLRMEHTHCYNLNHKGDAGHYHFDTTPDTIEYEGYFNVAERVYRLDGPHKK